jgi:adenosylcobinamide kinase / adenosylcobinamide-phosphate guanylyltransferase
VAIVVVGGGARSGKSTFALNLARKRGGRLVYLATAQAHDLEMEARIARHRAERPDFDTVEEPLEIAAVIQKSPADVLLIDCLTLWLSNIMLSFGRDIDADTEELVAASQSRAALTIMVTNEVGCGIVPENTLGRDFRDRAGILNQRVAAVADEVYWMIFGNPLRVK